MKKIYLLSFIFIVTLFTAQVFNWQKTFGGTLEEEFTKSVETTDGNIVFTGNTLSNNGDFTINNGLKDVFITKIDENGNYLWKKTLGGNNQDIAINLIKSNDGGVILVTRSYSTIGFFSSNLGDYDLWLTKIDTNGNIVWNKTFAGSGSENSSGIFSINNGYIFTINTNSSDNDFMHTGTTKKDVWLFNIDESGSVVWKKRLEGSLDEEATMLKSFDNNSFVVLVNSGSIDGNFASNTFATINKGFLYKFNNNGNILLNTMIESTNQDKPNLINNIEFYNNDYVVSGTETFPFSFPGNSTIYQNINAMFAKVSSSGSLIWKTNYSYENNPQPDNTIFSTITSDNKLAFFGETVYYPTVTGWMVKVDDSGNIINTKFIPGFLKSFTVLPSGDFLLNFAGYNQSVPGSTGAGFFGLSFVHSLVTNLNLSTVIKSNDFALSNSSSSIIKNGKIISFWQSRNNFAPIATAEDIWISSYTIPYYVILATEDSTNSLKKLSIYPNPVQDELHLSERVDHITIFDVIGKKISQVKNTDVINMQTFLPGNYFLKAEVRGKLKTFKIIKK